MQYEKKCHSNVYKTKILHILEFGFLRERSKYKSCNIEKIQIHYNTSFIKFSHTPHVFLINTLL